MHTRILVQPPVTSASIAHMLMEQKEGRLLNFINTPLPADRLAQKIGSSLSLFKPDAAADEEKPVGYGKIEQVCFPVVHTDQPAKPKYLKGHFSLEKRSFSFDDSANEDGAFELELGIRHYKRLPQLGPSYMAVMLKMTGFTDGFSFIPPVSFQFPLYNQCHILAVSTDLFWRVSCFVLFKWSRSLNAPLPPWSEWCVERGASVMKLC